MRDWIGVHARICRPILSHPFASSLTGAICDPGFDAESLSNLPRSLVDGPYASVIRAAKTVALRRRRRCTVREMNAARTNKSKIRVTFACVSPGVHSATVWRRGFLFSNRKIYILSLWAVGNQGNGT